MLRFFVFALTLSCAYSQTLVYNRSVVNAASYMQQGLPGGGIAQGSIFSIFGAGLGPTQGVSANSFPLGNTLAGTSITITQGATVVNAIPVYVSATQINAIMPSNAPLGTAALRVNVNNVNTNYVPVQIASSAFGIFAANSAGSGPGILQNFVSATDLPINSPTIAAQPGQTITLWGTGLGPVAGGDNVAPPVGNLPIKTEVFVGGQSATVVYNGRAPCCAGTDQIDFVVPANAPTGCWVPVYVRTNGTNISNFVTMAIENNGATCADAFNPLAQALVAGGNTGAVAAVRENTDEDIGTVAPTSVAADFTVAGFSNITSEPFAFSPAVSLPPPGTCTEYTGNADLLNGSFVGLSQVPPGGTLNAGSPVVSGPGGSYPMTSIIPDYSGFLIGSTAGGTNLVGNLSLNPGNYTVAGGGGSDVGPFSANLNVPQPITWSNEDQLTQISRALPLTISWTGAGPNDVVAVVGFGLDLPTNSGAAFACLAQPGASSLTISSDILANLPATEPYLLNSTDVIYLVHVPQSAIAKFSATGLSTGVALFSYVNGKTVIFQ